jgi:hypothetical protein
MEPSENTSKTKSTAAVTPVSFYEKHKTVYMKEVKGWWNTWRWR